ncbi:MAG: type II toxin-antitoxin system PemK/MazF family toxin [Chthoniobacteraceae bacterium]
MTPARGEVWMVDLGLAAKVRPCQVINIPFADNERAIFAIVPHTTSLWNTRFEIPTELTWLDRGAFDAQGLRPVPRKVFERRLGAVPGDLLARVEATVRVWFGL